MNLGPLSSGGEGGAGEDVSGTSSEGIKQVFLVEDHVHGFSFWRKSSR